VITTDGRIVIYATFLSWLMLVIAALLRTRGLTPRGLKAAFGNRHDLPEPTPLSDRADRAARNMLENLVLFVALVVAAHIASAPQHRIDLGARIFFYARVAYVPVYLFGISYLRTAIWSVSLVGLGIIAAAAL
jgi:uncharacterized MAPEG superfamily protein